MNFLQEPHGKGPQNNILWSQGQANISLSPILERQLCPLFPDHWELLGSCLSHLWSCSVFTVKLFIQVPYKFARICWGSKGLQAEDENRGKTASGCHASPGLASEVLLKMGWQLVSTKKRAVEVSRQNLETSKTPLCGCLWLTSRCLYDGDDAFIADFPSSILSGMVFMVALNSEIQMGWLLLLPHPSPSRLQSSIFMLYLW